MTKAENQPPNRAGGEPRPLRFCFDLIETCVD